MSTEFGSAAQWLIAGSRYLLLRLNPLITDFSVLNHDQQDSFATSSESPAPEQRSFFSRFWLSRNRVSEPISITGSPSSTNDQPDDGYHTPPEDGPSTEAYFTPPEKPTTIHRPQRPPSNYSPASVSEIVVSQKLASKLAAQAAHDELLHRRPILERFRWSLMCTTINIKTLAFEYNQNLPEKAAIISTINEYLAYIKSRLAQPGVTHLNLINGKEYPYDDFFAYGRRFLEYVKHSGHFLSATSEFCRQLEAAYYRLLPPEVRQLRKKLREAKEEIARWRMPLVVEERFKGLKLAMITYKPVDSSKLHTQLQFLPSPDQQLSHFLAQIRSSQTNQQNAAFLKHHLQQLLSSSLVPFEKLRLLSPQLHQFGSLSNGLGSYDSDLDLVVRFDAFPSVDLLDYETALLALEVVEMALKKQMGLDAATGSAIVRSRRCPIVQLDLGLCFPKLKDPQNPNLIFNKCDISASALYGVHNSALLNFLTRHEARFGQLTQLLKYWAKRSGLIGTEAFSSYAFILLIVFYLQAGVSPPVLPSIQQLQRLAHKQQRKRLVRIHRYQFEFCDDHRLVAGLCSSGANREPVQQLVVGFFRFYRDFDFSRHAICPRLGTSITKEALYAEKETQKLDFGHASAHLVIEDPFVLDHNVGGNFRHDRYWNRWTSALDRIGERISADNAVLVLTDPVLFGDVLAHD